MGFGSEKSFAASLLSDNESTFEEETPVEVTTDDHPIKPTRKRRFHEFHQKRSIKTEKHANITPEPVQIRSKSQKEEADELFDELKCLVPDTLTITLLQTAMALVKAGFTESLGIDTHSVKQEKRDIKQEDSSKSSFVKNKRNFFALGRNRHLAKLKMIKKKGLYQTKNLLAFEVRRC